MKRIVLFFILFCCMRFVSADALVVNHAAVREFDQIPPEWLAAAKQLTIQYAHRSDGNNVLEGAYYLNNLNSTKYKLLELDVGAGGVPSLPTQQNPPGIRLMDGNPPTDQYSYPSLYWASTTGINATMTNANSGLFNISMWSWCDEMTYYTAVQIQQYFLQMNQFEQRYPNVKFIYMTGYTENSNPTVVANNQFIRNYSVANNKILYDFDDIIKYDPDGTYYPAADRGCTWCQAWCASHPANCTNLPSCSHSNGGYSNYMCVLRGKAFWWMMARLAGWPGVNATTNTTSTNHYANCAAVPSAILANKTCREINNCTTLNFGDSYYLLTQDIASDGTCITLGTSSNNKFINLNNHTITYGDVYGNLHSGIWMTGGHTNTTITNGVIKQGSGAGVNSSCIRSDYNGGKTNVHVSYVDCYYYGDDSSGFDLSTNVFGNISAHDNRIYPNVSNFANRMVVHAGIAAGTQDEAKSGDSITVYNNKIIGKGHGGINVGRNRSSIYINPALIYNNTIQMWGACPNPIAIAIDGYNYDVFNNFINQTNARGIYFAGAIDKNNEGASNARIYNNYVEVRENAHPEYTSDDPIGGPVGIRIRYGSHDGIIYNNTIFAHTEPGFGHAIGIRISVGGVYSENITLVNNTIIAISTDPERYAISLMIEADDGLNNSKDTYFINNRLISNSNQLSLGGSNGAPKNVILTSNTLVKQTPSAANYATLYGARCGGCDSLNDTIIDTLFESGANYDDAIFGGTGLRDIRISWYLDVHVQNQSGVSLQNANVIIRNVTNSIIFTGQTVDGDIPTQTMEEFSYVGSGSSPSKYYESPYNISVTYQGITQSRLVTLNQSKTEVFIFSGSNCTLAYDLAPCNCIDLGELGSAIDGWDVGSISISQLIADIKSWKQGC
jgi:hypothetical protein